MGIFLWMKNKEIDFIGIIQKQILEEELPGCKKIYN